MSSSRCSHCDIDYPDDEDRCHVCGDTTWQNKDDYDPEWPDRVEMLLKRRKIFDLEGIPDVSLTILDHKGRQWVVEELLEAEGYVCTDLGIVKINGDYYELSGRRDGEIPAWWIELIRWEAEFRELDVMTPKEYASLNERRGL